MQLEGFPSFYRLRDAKWCITFLWYGAIAFKDWEAKNAFVDFVVQMDKPGAVW